MGQKIHMEPVDNPRPIGDTTIIGNMITKKKFPKNEIKKRLKL